jgi:hypothetical protein
MNRSADAALSAALAVCSVIALRVSDHGWPFSAFVGFVVFCVVQFVVLAVFDRFYPEDGE